MGHRELDVASFRAWLARARDEITRSRTRLNAENLYPVADADTGSNLEATIQAAASAVEREGSDQLHIVADAAADGALHGAQGNSGVLLSQILRGFADGLRENLPKAFALAHERAFKAVSDPKEGTILTVARAARDATSSLQSWSSDVRRDAEIALAAWKAARASTLDSANNPPSEASRGTIDAGAHGIELIYRSLVAVLDSELENVADIPDGITQKSDRVEMVRKSDGAFEVMYELSDVSEEKIELLRANLAGIGESLLVVGESSFWKVHIHTDFVEETISFAKEVGAPQNIRITALEATQCNSERKLITAANGPGFEALMRESGVLVISAYDSRRVEPEEWIAQAGGSQEVILIPHDLHGYESASIAAEILKQRAKTTNTLKKVAVISSRSPLQAIASISTHSDDMEIAFDDEIVAMQSAAEKTRSITIAFAPREMKCGEEIVKAGLAIALVDRKIITFGVEILDVAERAVEDFINSDTQLITLVTGADAAVTLADDLSERLIRVHPHVEVTNYSGGQAWYPLLIGIE